MAQLIRFRSFRNSDPPKLLQLFRQTRPGRAFAYPDSSHALEMSVFCLPYFDPRGLIIAEDGDQMVGFIHAGFGFSDDLSQLNYDQGVICCVLVRPEIQQKGVGKELVLRAEEYLKAAGAKHIQAGQSRFRDPFYFGIYGGARPSGFMESDKSADPFFKALGYVPIQRVPVFQRDLTDRKDPMNFRLMALRRQTELIVSDQPEKPSWWWYCRFGNIESMRFQLVEKKTGASIATVTVVGLDHYIQSWNERAIGLVDVLVEEPFRAQGFGQTLIVEAIRRLRTEMITRAEIHIPEDFQDAVGAILASGFTQVDAGIIYARPEESPER
ncbi:GNAT family N-acetyltransferase [Planctomicrobium sp. SH661]|uniref:GNAT family N-acetyltransferase n=1 Tax=Planctomicrobium sp. SH661 TaxID=3448124 RepID=UPI003F5B12FC